MREQAESSRLIASLESETRAHPYEPKRLIGPDVNYGRELLAALARRTGGWIGWEATSLRRIAGEIAFVPLHAAKVRVGGDIEIRALVNRALGRAIETKLLQRDFAVLSRSLGFRRALQDSVLELRVGGISPTMLREASKEGSPASGVAVVLQEYQMLLHEIGITDAAGVFRIALDHFDSEARYGLTGPVLLAPTLVEHGLPGELLKRLISAGARVLDSDGGAVNSVTSDRELDMKAAPVEMFVAATPNDELSEVLRRVVGERLRWDDVEIVSTNVDAYGVELDVLCRRLRVGGTMLYGIPLARTRLGRILERWFTWLANGLPADLLRQALEAGEIGDDLGVEPELLARELRAQRIGWGRQRYSDAALRLGASIAGPQLPQHDDESDEKYRHRLASRERSAAALRVLLTRILEITPGVPERGDSAPVTSTASQLATSTLGWLALVNVHGFAESQTLERVRARLQAVADLADSSTAFGIALATVRDALSDVRAWPLATGDSKPRRSAGGAVHLTDLDHAGTTGRKRIFIVGLDSDASNGTARQNPLIPDAVRAALPANSLATTMQRRDDRAFVLRSALAGLRGRVTLSYATASSIDGGEVAPAPELLQLRRKMHRDPTLTYSTLREHLGVPASAVPLRGDRVALLGARDVWLDVLADGPILLNGEGLVRKCFSLLDRGMTARVAARSSGLTQFTGNVPRAAGALDPRKRPDRPTSASALKKLAECPLAWFYHYGLHVRPPEDPEYDLESWLNSAQRGALLHEVFEQFAVRYADRRAEINGRSAEVAMEEIVDAAVGRWLLDVPPPGSAVRDSEADELRRAAASFLSMERHAHANGDDGSWRYFEYEFGGDSSAPAHYALTDGTFLTVAGRVDRIDSMSDGSFRVIDYKAGVASYYRKAAKLGPFNGGRQMQPAIYAEALNGVLDATVTRFEYRFPTERGQNQSVSYTAAELAEASPIVTQLLEHVTDGTFIPTTNSSDCKLCSVQAICRVERDRHGSVTSPRAEWAEDNAAGIDAYRGMLMRRTKAAQE